MKKTKKPVTKVTFQDHPGSWRTVCQCGPLGCALYRCLKCDNVWHSLPSKQSCSLCGHHRFVWVNYIDWCKVHSET